VWCSVSTTFYSVSAQHFAAIFYLTILLFYEPIAGVGDKKDGMGRAGKKVGREKGGKEGRKEGRAWGVVGTLMTMRSSDSNQAETTISS
jgi:hypothetical protein